MANEHSIRVSARGEFGQLERGLKNLQKDLGGVLGEIDKGARKGGIFDDTQLRALDIFKGRFTGTMREMEAEFRKQNDIIDKMYKSMETAQRSEKRHIQDNIDLREKELDVLRRQLRTAEDIYSKRTSEAGGYSTQPSTGVGSEASQSALNDIGANSKLDKIFKVVGGFGKGALGLAGIGGVGAILTEAYQQAYSRSVGSLDIAQRVRGQAGYSGSAKDIHDQMRDTGLRNNLGFSSEAVMGVQDIYSSMAGPLGTKGLEDMLTFSRGYGIDENQTASLLGENQRIGGSPSPSIMADAISQSVEQSGMLARIVEVMETNNALTAELSHTFNNYESETYLGYQTVLDKIGMQNSMTGLTGSEGADVLSGLGGIFNPQEGNQWKWYGIQALQQYKPEEYEGKSLYSLESSFEDGLANTDNLPAMAKFLRENSGGDQELFQRLIQKWLMDGGFVANKRQAGELSEVTENFTVFDSAKIDAVIAQNAGGDASAKYNEERVGEEGQNILQIEAEWQKNLEQVGEDFLGIVMGLKDTVGGMVSDVGEFTDVVADTVDELLRILEELTGLDFTGLTDTLLDNWELVVGSLVGAKIAKDLFDKVKGKSKKSGDGDEDDDDRNRNRNNGNGDEDEDDDDRDRNRNRNNDDIDLYDDDDTNADDDNNKKKGWGSKLFEKFDDMKLPKGLKYGAGGALALVGGIGMADVFGEQIDEFKARKDAGENNFEAGGKVGLDFLWDSTIGSLMDIGGQNKFGTEGNIFFKEVGELAKASSADIKALADNGTLAVDGLSSAGRYSLERLASMGLIKFEDMGTSSSTTLQSFSEVGQAELLKLQEQGLISIGGLQADGTAKITALNEDGATALKALNEEGLIMISAFDETGRLKITELSDYGLEEILKLQENGSLSLDGMDKTADEKLESMRKHTHEEMEEIEKEHKTMGQLFSDIFKEWDWGDLVDSVTGFFKDLFKDWSWEGFKSLFPWGDSSVGGGGGGFDGDVRNGISDVTAKQLNKGLKGELAGHGDDFVKYGKEYGINPGVLSAIAMHETGNGTSPAVKARNNVGGMMRADGGGLMTFDSIEDGIEAMASNLKRLYTDQGLVTIEEIQKKYAPNGAKNDPTGLNKHWVNGVHKYLDDLGVSMSTGSSDIGNEGFWKGWNKRITSVYGHNRGSHTHKGLDIDGKQGDTIQALANGVVDKIYMDDGGKHDPDGKNSRSGGTELIVRMPNGEKYFYSHLSQIAPDIMEKYFAGETVSIAQGQNVAKMGGDRGMAGSGYSTTGSHLHLGYMNKQGKLADPRLLLDTLLSDSGDSDIGREASEVSQVQNLIDTQTGNSSVASGGGETVHTVNMNHNVTLNVNGEGATLLNESTVEQLKRLIKQVVTDNEDQHLSFNPLGRGWT